MDGVVVLHDYLTQKGGAERVALLLAQTVGGGRITTSAYSAPDTFPEFEQVDVTELAPSLPPRTKVSRSAMAVVAARTFPRHAVEADVVLCSSSGWSHWTGTDSPTVVYCHTPPRWFWAPQDYFSSLHRPARDTVVATMGRVRTVDHRRAQQRTRYLANSTVVRDRIRTAYGLDAEVVFPPVSFSTTGPAEPTLRVAPGFVLMIARNRGYKHVDLARRVFDRGGLGQLVVVGAPPGVSPGGRVVSTGMVTDAQLRWLYAHCRAVLALSHEDFGLTPVEGHAFGRPTVALRAGGYLDTCVEGVNAVFTDDLEERSVRAALCELDSACLREDVVRASSRRYAVPTFLARLGAVLDETRAS